jgi:hypothetical protein
VAVYGLYEISIQLVRRVEKKRTEELRARGLLDEDEDLYDFGDGSRMSQVSDETLARIAAALERISPRAAARARFRGGRRLRLACEPRPARPGGAGEPVSRPLLVGIDRARDTLLANTLQFARGLPANNALLWGARGMGKSSLVKAIHAQVVAEGLPLKIVEIQREDLPSIGRLLNHLRGRRRRGSCCSATTCPSAMTTSTTSRSRPCSTAGSRGGPTTWSSTPPRTGAT